MKQIRTPLVLFVCLALITGVVYPAVVTLIAGVAFPSQANGSLILKDGKPVGSQLIGQQFDDPKYFWGRLSATSDSPYNGKASGGSNFGPVSKELTDELSGRIKALKEADPGNRNPIPTDLVTSSASGLDPHISVAAAEYQAGRVARVRAMSVGNVNTLIRKHTEPRALGFLGEPVVNVLELNLDLDLASK